MTARRRKESRNRARAAGPCTRRDPRIGKRGSEPPKLRRQLPDCTARGLRWLCARRLAKSAGTIAAGRGAGDRDPTGAYARRRVLFWRLRIPLWLASGTAGWDTGGAADAALPAQATAAIAGVAVACLAEAAFCYRRVQVSGNSAPPSAEKIGAAIRRQRRWQIEAVPSPGGWTAPSGTLPAWNWLPPGAGPSRALSDSPPGYGCGT